MEEKKKEEKKKKKIHAVPLSKWMRENVLPLRTGFESDFESVARDKQTSAQLIREIKQHVNHWLDAAEKLPETPARRVREKPISQEWLAAARSELEPVDLSWVRMCQLLKVLARVLRYFSGYEGATTRKLLKRPKLFGTEPVLEADGYRLYISLRSWLYRRSNAGKRKARAYEQKPEVKKRRKKTREQERDRKRAWRAANKARETTEPGLAVEEWEPSDDR